MRLVTFATEGTLRPGLLVENDVLDLVSAGLPAGPAGDLMAIVAHGPGLLDRLRTIAQGRDTVRFRLEDVELQAPILAPPKIIGIGLNYIDHCEEANLKVPAEPVIFTKYATSVIGPAQDIVFDTAHCTEIDYEVELGVIIGRTVRAATAETAMDAVFGYTIVNDVTARDLQFRDGGQWDLAKSLDTFCPYGPAIVTADEVPDPQQLELTLDLNGSQMQKSHTSNMIFGVAELIAFISRGITLQPGDLITTGTPFGVGFTRKPPVYLRDGDICELRIEGLGVLRNPVKAYSEGGGKANR